MVQEYKSSDLDLFDKIDLHPIQRMSFLKNKSKNQQMSDDHKKL